MPHSGAPASTGISPEAQAIVDEESAISTKVAKRLAATFADENQSTVKHDVAADLIILRDQIAEARLEDVPALINEMMRVAAISGVEAPEAQGKVDPTSPYFGHMRLAESWTERGKKARVTGTRDVLIGKRSLVDREAGVVIVDWRNAPISRLYYRYEEGDEYDEEFGDEVREGLVNVRRTVSFKEGRVVRVKTPDHALVRMADGTTWAELNRGELPELKGGAGTAERLPTTRTPSKQLGHAGPAHTRPDKHLPEIAALIDPSQFDAMTENDGGVVVLQGGAGSGKTTVALHRIAYLAFKDPKRFRPSNILVVVQQPALVRYVSRVLPSLDVSDVKVSSYRDWALGVLKTIVPGFRREVLDDAPAEVSQLKKNPRLLNAIAAQTANRRATLRHDINKALSGRPGGDELCAALSFDDDTPILSVCRQLLATIHDAEANGELKDRARRAVDATIFRAQDLIGEWEELITDATLLAPVLEGEHALDRMSFESALRWTAQQIDEPVDEEYDPEARIPIDGNDDDDGPGYRLDPHDLAVLLNLWIARTGGLTHPRTGRAIQYDHVAVDEAQDFSAVELLPLIIAAGEHRSVTLAGDVVQKVVFDNGFTTWEELLEQLGTSGRAVEPFRLSYRSTAEVTKFAHDALGPLAPKEQPKAIRHGAPVGLFLFDEPAEEIAFLADALRGLMAREPNANVAILARYPERADYYAALLRDAEVPFLRHVRAGEFLFSPGVDVTHIAQAKGLEYDYIVLVDVDAQIYPDQPAARHLLHIGATRAAHQLWVLSSSQRPSPLLSKEMVDEARARP